jgi:transcriptional regulator with XRE-family HTH domain
MPDSFGARLRQQRERQQIELAAIAEQTKIGLSLLEALERDDVSHWPAGIFRRSFIRAYAQAIRLDANSVVREFLDLYPDPGEDVAEISTTLEMTRGESARPPTRLRCLIASTFAALPLRRQTPAATGLLTRPEHDPVDTSSRATTVQREPDRPIRHESARAKQREADVAIRHEPDVPTPRAPGIAAPLEPGVAVPPEPDLVAAARLCTQLGRVVDTRDMEPLIGEAAGVLGAVGIIVWLWDPRASVLKPALAHGYSADVLARVPGVRRDGENATATAFRSAQPRVVEGSDAANGAVAVPLMTPTGCVGVFAVELPCGGEQRESIRALATIFAAQLATLFGYAPLADAVNA